MSHRNLTAAVALLASAAFTLRPDAPAPVPGPGGVIDAVNRFLLAADDKDQATLALIVDDQGDNLHDYATAGESTKAVKASAAAFYECDANGSWQAGDKASFVAGLGARAAGPRTRVLSVRANCLSERCSYAMVEFERTSGEGDAAITVPMRATALLRYAPTEGAPPFKIYHWHASRGPSPANAVPEKETAKR